MPWLQRVCGGFVTSPAWRLYCGDCLRELGVEADYALRVHETHADEPCDMCQRVVESTVPHDKVQVSRARMPNRIDLDRERWRR